MDLKNFSTLLDTFTPNPLSHSSPEDKLKQYKGPKDVNNKPDSQSHTEDQSSTTLINRFHTWKLAECTEYSPNCQCFKDAFITMFHQTYDWKRIMWLKHMI